MKKVVPGLGRTVSPPRDNVESGELTELYERYGYLVLRRCRTILGNNQDARDAAQEVFLRVRRLNARPTQAGSTLAWLYTIALNCSTDLMRKTRREELA